MQTFLTNTQSTYWMLAVVVGTLVVRADYPTSTDALPMQPQLGDGLECANDFILHDGSCYYYSGQDANKAFHQAEKACRRRNSTLVSIRSSSEHDFVARLVHNGSFWIGLNDADGPSQHHKEGVFKWTDGGSFVEVHSYSRWKEGEPQNHRHLDCIRSDADGWSIAQGGCATTKLPYVCEMNACMQWNTDECASSKHGHLPPSLLLYVSFTAAGLGSITLLVAMTCFVYHRTISNKTHTFSSKFMLPT